MLMKYSQTLSCFVRGDPAPPQPPLTEIGMVLSAGLAARFHRLVKVAALCYVNHDARCPSGARPLVLSECINFTSRDE